MRWLRWSLTVCSVATGQGFVCSSQTGAPLFRAQTTRRRQSSRCFCNDVRLERVRECGEYMSKLLFGLGSSAEAAVPEVGGWRCTKVDSGGHTLQTELLI